MEVKSLMEIKRDYINQGMLSAYSDIVEQIDKGMTLEDLSNYLYEMIDEGQNLIGK